MDNSMTEIFGEVISTYTRKHAVEDGEQVLVDNMGFYKYPVYLTSSVYSIVERAVANKNHCNDFDGVMWDILYMSTHRQKELNPSIVRFPVIITSAGRKKDYEFIAQISATDIDDASPCITIMLPEER